MGSSFTDISCVEDAIATDRLIATAAAFDFYARAKDVREYIDFRKENKSSGAMVLINMVTVLPMTGELIKDAQLNRQEKRYLRMANQLLPPEELR